MSKTLHSTTKGNKQPTAGSRNTQSPKIPNKVLAFGISEGHSGKCIKCMEYIHDLVGGGSK